MYGMCRPCTASRLLAYAGVYSTHGVEVLSLSYSSSGSGSTRIVAAKITGDANVPAGACVCVCDCAVRPAPPLAAAPAAGPALYSTPWPRVGSGATPRRRCNGCLLAW